MRVLHIFNEIRFSGAEVMYVSAASRFRDAGIHNIAVSTGVELGDYSSVFESRGIGTLHLPFIRSVGLFFMAGPYILHLASLLKKERIDVLHIHREQLYWCFAISGFLAGVRTIRTVHNVFIYRGLAKPREWVMRYICRVLLRVVFQTIGKSVYENELVRFRNPSVRINNWFDIDRFFPTRTSDERNKVRELLGIRSDVFVIVSAGSCSEVKNHADILRALAVLPKGLRVLYLHLGCGPLETMEQSLAQKLGILDKILFLGNCSDVRQHLIAADAYVMPSKFEGLSISAIEAMACGIPVILYNVAGLRDLITNNETGYLVEPSYQALAYQIRYVAENPTHASQRAEKGRLSVFQDYNMRRSVDQIVALYKGDGASVRSLI